MDIPSVAFGGVAPDVFSAEYWGKTLEASTPELWIAKLSQENEAINAFNGVLRQVLTGSATGRKLSPGVTMNVAEPPEGAAHLFPGTLLLLDYEGVRSAASDDHSDVEYANPEDLAVSTRDLFGQGLTSYHQTSKTYDFHFGGRLAVREGELLYERRARLVQVVPTKQKRLGYLALGIAKVPELGEVHTMSVTPLLVLGGVKSVGETYVDPALMQSEAPGVQGAHRIMSVEVLGEGKRVPAKQPRYKFLHGLLPATNTGA